METCDDQGQVECRGLFDLELGVCIVFKVELIIEGGTVETILLRCSLPPGPTCNMMLASVKYRDSVMDHKCALVKSFPRCV